MAYIDSSITFRANWARRLAYKNISKAVSHHASLEGSIGQPTPEFLPLLQQPPSLNGPTDASVKVGIIGAGAAGLMAGLVIDFLKSKLPNLNLEYSIYEADDGQKRVGGRLFTYSFANNYNGHQYYDVGAMRFPKNPVMDRTFQLFNLLGMNEYNPPKPDPNPPIGCLIPYYFQGVNTPWNFNDESFIGPAPWSAGPNTFKITGDIPYLNQNPSDVVAHVVQPFIDLLVNDINKGAHNGPGWRKLMNADKYSTRDYLLWWKKIEREENGEKSSAPKVQSQDDEIDGYSADTIAWLETFNAGTHWYNQAFSETVLETMDFNYPTAKSPQYPADSVAWWCVQGGVSELAKRMTARLTKKPFYNCRVRKISQTSGKLKVDLISDEPVGTFDAVLNATTLGAMQRMDLTNANLNYGTKQAIRTLTYGASCKVGIQFDRPWWITDCQVTQAGLGHSDLPIRTCVYPSYNLYDDPSGPAVLLCSYTWDGDAQRMASLISRNSPNDDPALLKPLLISDLARLHSTPETYRAMHQIISRSWITHHAYDWFTDPSYAGAFAYFGPGQFERMWPDIVTPQSDGNLIIIGEHASAHHAWVVGALESAVRGVWQVLHRYSGSITDSATAMQLLEDPKSAPFGPLPLESAPVILQWQNVLARARNEKK